MTTNIPKVLLFDIETKPVRAWIWRTGKQVLRHNQIADGEKFDIICIAYKWAHEKTIHALDWGRQQNSAAMIDAFVKLVEKADVVVGQNSDAFDIKQINTQRMLHKQPPIAWPTAEDTRKQIKRHFYVTSSSLEYMSKLLTGEGKQRMEFIDWIDIVERKSAAALRKMVTYCKHDVQKLQDVWERIRPYVTPKAHRGVIAHGDRDSCPSCGSLEFQNRGVYILTTGRYRRRSCKSCGHFWRGARVTQLS